MGCILKSLGHLIKVFFKVHFIIWLLILFFGIMQAAPESKAPMYTFAQLEPIIKKLKNVDERFDNLDKTTSELNFQIDALAKEKDSYLKRIEAIELLIQGLKDESKIDESAVMLNKENICKLKAVLRQIVPGTRF